MLASSDFDCHKIDSNMVVDIILIVNYILYNQSDFDNIECLGDLDGNNIVDILDVVLLIEYILGIN